MSDNIIDVMNKLGEEEGIPNRIYFCNIHKESTLDDLYGDIDSQDDSSCASNESWDMPKNGEIDLKKIKFDNAVNDDEVDNLDNEDTLRLNDGLANNNNNNNNNNDNNNNNNNNNNNDNDNDNDNDNIEHIVIINQQDKQQNHVGIPNNNLQPENDHFKGLGEHHPDDNEEGENNNEHVHILDDDKSDTDYKANGNNLNDNQQYGFDSQGDFGSELKNNDSDKDSEPGQDEIDQSEDPVSLSRHHNMSF